MKKALLLSAMFICMAAAAMAQVKISQLPVGGAIQSTDIVPVARSGITYGASPSGFLFSANNLSDLSSAVAARTNLGLTIGSNVEAWSSVLDSAAASHAAGMVFATPSGSSGTASFRSLLGSDLPAPGASSLGGVESLAPITHQFLTGISTSGVPSQAQPAFSDLSGSATLSQFPSIAANTVIGNGTASVATPTALSMPSCSGANNALQWVAGTGWQCGTISSGGTPGGTSGQIQYNNGGAFGGLALGSGLTSSGGTLNTTTPYRLVTASGAVTLTTSDGIVEINQSGTNNITVNLPSSPTVGQIFTIKDGAFNGSTYILTPASGNIDGASTYTMYGNGSSTDVFFNGTNWRIK